MKWVYEDRSFDCENLTLKLPKYVLNILVNRSITDAKTLMQFFSTDIKDLIDYYSWEQLDETGKFLVNNLDKKILVWGDYDVDGITATALMVNAFEKLGKKVSYYIPDRFNDGYGLSREVLEEKLNEFDLLITVDCGIKDVEVVDWLKEKGKRVIVTDHHLSQEVVNADFVLNPNLQGIKTAYAGVGVAYCLARKILELKGIIDREKLTGFEDLVAFGTIADMVPLVRDNRLLVKIGMELINKKANNLGLRVLKEKVLKDRNVRTSTFSFIFAPRINAAGRIGKAVEAFELFITKDENEAREIIAKLEKYNFERQKKESKVFQEARKMVKDGNKVLYKADWHPGVLGIVASKLKDEFNEPIVLLTDLNDRLVGSCRAPNGFNLIELLSLCDDYLLSWGGHKMAAGVKVDVDYYEEFKEKFEGLLDNYEREDEVIVVDADISIEMLDYKFYEHMQKLQPFGVGNPEPVFSFRNLKVKHIEEKPNFKYVLLESRTAKVFAYFKKDVEIDKSDTLNLIANVDVDQRGKFILKVIDWHRSIATGDLKDAVENLKNKDYYKALSNVYNVFHKNKNAINKDTVLALLIMLFVFFKLGNIYEFRKYKERLLKNKEKYFLHIDNEIVKVLFESLKSNSDLFVNRVLELFGGVENEYRESKASN